MATRRPVTEQSVEEGSVQLEAGQRFHHMGKNGVPYLRMEVRGMPNGDLYPVVSTPDAASVLPVVLDGNGKVVGAYFLHQRRPETSGTSVKATGNYCLKDETRVDAALRALRVKLGISARAEDLFECGESYGYGDQYNFPVSCYIVTAYDVDHYAELPKGCERMYHSLSAIAVIHAGNGFFGDETAHLVLTMMMRNSFPYLYGW